jgi:hypothetical protein
VKLAGSPAVRISLLRLLSPQLCILYHKSQGRNGVKNIVILSDGTGQGASMPRAERSNVWKLWDAPRTLPLLNR